MSHRTTRLGAGVGGRAQALQRVVAVGAPAVEEVLGVVDHALALADEERDRRADHVEVLLARDLDDLLEVQAPGLADQRADRREAVGEHAQRRVVGRRDVAAARHPERGDLGVLEALAREQLEQLELLGVRRREAGLDQVDAELVELVGDAQLLGSAERHVRALHAIAQGRVVELDHATLAGDRDRVQPLAVALGAAVQRVVERLLDRARDLARLAGADRVVVDLAHGTSSAAVPVM